MIGDENSIGTMQRGSMAMVYRAPPRHVSKLGQANTRHGCCTYQQHVLVSPINDGGTLRRSRRLWRLQQNVERYGNRQFARQNFFS